MLLLISGASGVGKSTTRRLIQDRLGEQVEAVELVDIAPLPALPTIRWRHETAETAVRRAVQLGREGRHLLLAGDPVVPGEILATPSANKVDIAICLLDADEATQTTRLRERGDPEEMLRHHVAFADWLRRHALDPQHMLEVITRTGWDQMEWTRLRDVRAGDPRWRIPVIDSTGLGKEDVAERALRWAAGAVAGSEPIFGARWYLRAGPPDSTCRTWPPLWAARSTTQQD
jgi:GrpB-like predicted nucleotidyltransferase (UPF0157 family)